MNLNEFDELVRKQNKDVVARDYRIGVSGFDDEVKKLNKNNPSYLPTPPGYLRQEEEQVDPVFGKPTYLSAAKPDTRKEDTVFTKLGRFVLPSSLENAFGMDETQRKPKPKSFTENLQEIGNAQTIEMARRNPEMVGDLEYLKSGISFGNNLGKYLPGYENDIAPSDLPEPTTTSQKVAYGVGSLITMSLAQPLIESAFVSTFSKIPGGAELIRKTTEAAKLSPWKIGWPMAITKAGIEGGLFGLITENKQSTARNVLETAGTFAAFSAIAFPIQQFFRPILEKVGSSTFTPTNSRVIANDALNAIKSQETSGVIWFKNPKDPTQILKVTMNGVESVEKGLIPKGTNTSNLSSVEIEAFKENPSLYNELKAWLGGKKINVPIEPPVSVPNVEVPPVKAEVPVKTPAEFIAKNKGVTLYEPRTMNPLVIDGINKDGEILVFDASRNVTSYYSLQEIQELQSNQENIKTDYETKKSQAEKDAQTKLEKQQKFDNIYGYEKDLTPMQVGSVTKILNQPIKLKDGTYVPKKDWLVKRIGDGFTLSSDNSFLKEPGKDTGFNLNKTEGKFARFIVDSKPKTLEPIITREDSPYNKMKWHVVTPTISGGKTSEWYKTEAEAKYAVEEWKNSDVNKYKSPESKIFEQGKSGLETKSNSFELFENEGAWKVNGSELNGREVGNWVHTYLDKKQLKEYDSIRDRKLDGTKADAEKQLNDLIAFEERNKEAFIQARNAIEEATVADELSGVLLNYDESKSLAQNKAKLNDYYKSQGEEPPSISIDTINASKPDGNEPFAITPTEKDRTPFAITPTAPPSTEPFIPKEDISGEQVSRNLELIAEDINQKIQEKADSLLANIENPNQFEIEKALKDAKEFIKKTIEIQGEKIQRPDILVSKTQVKEMLAALEQDVLEMKAILKDGKKYLHFQRDEGVGSKVKTDMLLKPSALGLVEGNIKIGDTLKIDVKKLKPKGTSMRAVDSSGGVMASKGSQPIGTFEKQTLTPEKSVGDSFKLYEKVNEMIKKYAERVGEQYLPRGAKGVYYHGSTKNIRLTSMNELSTAAHEISHYLDEQFGLTSKFMEITGYSVKGNPIYDSATAKIRKDITKIYTNYYHGGKDDHKLSKRMTEGFATLVQKYVEMPTTMEQNFPDAVKQILKPGGEFYNDTIGEMLNDLKKIVVDYQALSPLDQIGAVVTSDKNPTGKASFLNFFQQLRTEVADEIYPIEVLGQRAGVANTAGDPSLWMRMYGLSNSYIINNLSGNKGYWRLKGGDLVKTNDSNWKNLLERLEKEKTFDSFGHYLVARDQHFQFKNLEKLKEQADADKKALKNASEEEERELRLISEKSQKDYEELKTVLDKNGIAEATATKAYEENGERFKEETELFDKLTREDIEFAHDNAVGLLNDEKYKEFIGKEGYAPLKREFYDDILGDEEVTSGTPAGTKVSTFKSRTGSSRTILNPVGSAMKAHAEITKKGLKQVVYNSIGKNIAKEFPELFQIQQLQTIPDKNTGGFIFPQEKDPNIIMAIINGKRVPILTDKYVKGIIDDVMTYQDIHVLEKVLMVTSRIFTKGTTAAYPQFLLANVTLDTISSTIQTQTKMMPIYSALKELSKAVMNSKSVEGQLLQKYLVSGGDRQVLVGYQNMSANELLEAVTKERKGILQVLDLINTGTELLSIPSKYSEIFTRATEYIRASKQGDPHIVALEKAGRVSAPFHHSGRMGGGRFGKTYIRSIPFFNPGLQVLDQTARTLETPEGRKRAAFVMAVLAALMAGGTAAIVAVGTEKQKRILADIDPKELNMYIHYPNPDGETLGKVRIPENYSWLGGALNMGIIDKELDAHYSKLDYLGAATTFIPNQLQPWEPKEWIFSLLPQLAKVPVLQASGKKDFPKVIDIESQGMLNKEPGLRYTDQSSVLAKWLGREFNLSPVKTDALLTGVFGRAAGYVTGKPSAYKISSALSRSEYFDSGRTMQLYYETKKENDLKTKSVKNRLREFTPEEKAETLKLNNILSQIGGLVERYRNIDEEKDPERAEEIKQSIYQLINEKLRDQ